MGEPTESSILPEETAPPPRVSGRALVFDSGMGGLTVARALMDMAPGLRVDYAADTGFFPYGEKADDALRARLPAAAVALCAEARPDVFVIACNTASTLALSEVRAALDIPVVGTVPAVKPAARLTRSGVIGVLATPGTVRRAYTADLIRDHAQGATVRLHGTVALVELAEQVAAGGEPPLAAFEATLAPLFDGPDGALIDTIVLACTHFPLVRDRLEAAAPRPITFVDSGEAIARQTLRVLTLGGAGRRDDGTPAAWLTSDPANQGRMVGVLQRYGYDRLNWVTVAETSSVSGSTAERP